MASLIFMVVATFLLTSIAYCLLIFRNSRSRGAPLPPGPRGWPILGNLPQLGPMPHQTLASLSRSYGPLFRLRFGSVNVVVAASSAVAAKFLRIHDSNFSNRPPNSGAEHVAYNYQVSVTHQLAVQKYSRLLTDGPDCLCSRKDPPVSSQDLVFAPYGPRWRMLRKLCAVHLFSPKALDDLRPVRQGEVASLVATLRCHTAAPVNLGKALAVCATNALARAMLGRKVFAEEEGQAEAVEFKEMVVELMRLAGVFNVGDFVPGIGWLDLQGVVGKMKKLHQRYDTFFDRIIEEHRAISEGGALDLLSILIRLKEDADEDGGKLNNTDIKALLLNLFTAGTDTSSSTAEWALAELIRHPDILRKVQQELDSVVGQDRLVSESDLPHLPVLQAVIKETFRLHPSTPLSLPRMSAEECVIDGYHIPKRTTLLVNIWAIGRDPTVWADPLEFQPARFLAGGEHEHVDVKGNDFELIPFGAGRRICAGMSLGLRMVQFMTATIVHAFDWALPEGVSPEKLDMKEAYGLTLQRGTPLMVRPIPRLPQKAYGLQ